MARYVVKVPDIGEGMTEAEMHASRAPFYRGRGHAGTTVLVTTHYMDEAEYCDRISIMVAGRIDAMGTPADLKQEYGADSIDEVFVRLARPANEPAGKP